MYGEKLNLIFQNLSWNLDVLELGSIRPLLINFGICNACITKQYKL